MKDPRITRLAQLLLDHSLGLKQGEEVLIRGHHIASPLIGELIEQTYQRGALPFIEIMDEELSRQLMLGCTEQQLQMLANWQMKKYEDVQAIINIIAEQNDAELAEIPADKFELRGRVMRPVSDFYVNHRRWVLLNYPTPGLAQKAKMSTTSFTDFLLNVCTLDYAHMAQAQIPLKQLMERTDKVRITGPETELHFSIKNIPAIPCAGECNIPDGEVFTAPVKDSVYGKITFNTPCPYRGHTFHDVCLHFEAGKIVQATADQTDSLNEILDTDEGARFVGEFALGLNPSITKPMGDILFDEKIGGSLHFTPGQAYEEADNGNRSTVHWDMVLMQTPAYGGGEIYFDDQLIRKDGLFVLPELKTLNPDLLK